MSSDIKSVKGPHQVSTHAATALKSGKDNRLCSVVSVCPVHPRSVTALCTVVSVGSFIMQS